MDFYESKWYYKKLDYSGREPYMERLLRFLHKYQVLVYVEDDSRAYALNKFLTEVHGFSSHYITSVFSEYESLDRYKHFMEGFSQILVVTDELRSHTCIEVDEAIIINYDMPESPEILLERVRRVSHYSKKTVISFVSTSDSDILNQLRSTYAIDIEDIPDFDGSLYTRERQIVRYSPISRTSTHLVPYFGRNHILDNLAAADNPDGADNPAGADNPNGADNLAGADNPTRSDRKAAWKQLMLRTLGCIGGKATALGLAPMISDQQMSCKY